MTRIHVGRKAMVAYLSHVRGWTTWRTVQKKIKSGELLIRRTPEGKPFIIEHEVESQLLKQSDAIIGTVIKESK